MRTAGRDESSGLMPTRDALRVLIACDHIAYDGQLHGSGRFLLELLDILQQRGVTVEAVVLRDPGGLAQRLAGQGLPLRILARGRFNPAPVVELARHALRLRADLLHVWDFGGATWGRLAGVLARRPVVVHVHSHHSAQQRRGFPVYVRFAYRLLAPLAARAVVISASVRTFAREQMGFTAAQLVTVTNPVPRSVTEPVDPAAVERLRRDYGIGAGEPVIGTVTRLFRVKGIDLLLMAFAQVLSSIPAARLLIVGDGPLRESLQQQARQLGIDARTCFAGYRDDVAAHYRLFSVTAMPSLEEGLGMTAIESIAAGTPLVASRSGGLTEVIEDDRTGLLVPVGDAQALAHGLVRVLGDARLAERLRAGCRAASQRFAPAVFGDAMVDVYRDVVAAAASPDDETTPSTLRASGARPPQ